MLIKSVKLNNFRNYSNTTVFFEPNLNVIVGKNAQGKTNLLEAIYFTAIGKSPRAKKDVDLIKWNEEKARIQVNCNRNDGNKLIEVYFSKDKKKSIRVNGINLLKIGELLGTLNCVYFSPDELKLVKESPEDRRKFMDIDISQLSNNYFYALIQYDKILLQRNKLLKEESEDTVLQTISIWDIQLAKYGAIIIKNRINFLKKIQIYANDALKFLTDNQENLVISYEGLVASSEEEIEKELLKKFEQNIKKDLKLKFTTVGPHRDDIKLVVNNIDIRNYGSQGQQRTVALSLKLAELEIVKEECNEYPILLLDDVLSELDENRQKRLLEISNKTQTIITTTNALIEKNLKCAIIKIENGNVIK